MKLKPIITFCLLYTFLLSANNKTELDEVQTVDCESQADIITGIMLGDNEVTWDAWFAAFEICANNQGMETVYISAN